MKTNYFKTLPINIISNIFYFLEEKNLEQVAQVDTRLSSLARHILMIQADIEHLMNPNDNMLQSKIVYRKLASSSKYGTDKPKSDHLVLRKKEADSRDLKARTESLVTQIDWLLAGHSLREIDLLQYASVIEA